MRIALVVPGFSASEDDWCIPALLNSVRELTTQHDVHIFTLRYPYHRNRYRVAGATVYPFNGQQSAGLRRIDLMWRAIQAMRQALRQQPFDLIHALWADEPALVASLVARHFNIPLIVSVMGGEFASVKQINYGLQLSWLMRHMINFSLRQSDCVTAGSHILRDRILAITKFPDQAVMRQPLGVDTSLFHRSQLPHANHLQGNPMLLIVASFGAIKNHQLAIRAMQIVQKSLPTACLNLIGSGELELFTQQLATSLGVNVNFVGEVDHDQLPSYYHAADLCLITSYYESQSMVALEAGACGKLTIGTRVGILPELVDDQYLVNYDDVEGLARIIVTLCTDYTIRQNLTAHVQEIIENAYTLHHQIDSWNALYADITSID